MKSHILTLLTIVTVVALAVQTSPPASAAGGIAYDSVTKIVMGVDPSSQQPGTFDGDFKTASEVTPAPTGGLFGQTRAAAENAMNMMHNGTAERHYIAGSKDRTDNLAMQTATIVDCSARTLTTLNLKDKTYRVTSLDQPSSPSSSTGGPSQPHPSATDDGSRFALAVTSRALGPKQIEGTNTNGYSSDVKMTVTKPGTSPSSYDMAVTAYYTGMPEPAAGCPSPFYASSVSRGPQAGAMMAGYAMAMRALRDAKGNPRITVSASGPALPLDKLSLWDLVTFSRGQNLSILSERGNVRLITDTDPVFSIPSDFTKQP
jgi:hypothetical protein